MGILGSRTMGCGSSVPPPATEEAAVPPPATEEAAVPPPATEEAADPSRARLMGPKLVDKLMAEHAQAWDYNQCTLDKDAVKEMLRKIERQMVEEAAYAPVLCSQGHQMTLLHAPPSDPTYGGQLGCCDGGGRGGCSKRVNPEEGYYHCDSCQGDSCRGCSGGLAITCCPQGHPLEYTGIRQSGWACDHWMPKLKRNELRKSEAGCKRGCTDFHQSSDWGNYRCQACDYDVCDYCCQKNKPDPDYDQNTAEAAAAAATFTAGTEEEMNQALEEIWAVVDETGVEDGKVSISHLLCQLT